ncbi:hypothetical protein BGU76_01540, partial [Clostridioides difficile]
MSLGLSIVLFRSTRALVADLKQMSNQRSEGTDQDMIFATQGMKDNEMWKLDDKLKTANGVYEGLYQKLMTYSCVAKVSELTDDYLNYEGSHSMSEMLELPVDMQFLYDRTYLNIIKSLGLPAEE